MAELIALDAQRHGGLYVRPNAANELAAKQHVINLRAAEIGKAASDFPVFIARNPHSGAWALSAMCSFEPGQNLLMSGNAWKSTYVPTAVRTYPLYLVQAPELEKGYAVGIDEDGDAFSRESGEALFDASGKVTPFVREVTALLEADISHELQTRQFLDRLAELKLIKAIDVGVQHDDGSFGTIKGLHTVDEDRLQGLSPELLQEFNQNGYLLSMHALLISSFQLHALIRRQGESTTGPKVQQIKLEVSKEVAVA